MSNCLFCRILAGELPCHRIYEDKHTLAFLDIHPINPGHVLVIPKEHAPDFYALDDSNYLKLMLSVKLIAGILNEIYQPQKMGMMAVGLDVPHAHIHLLPLHQYHDITSKQILEGQLSNPSQEELAEIAAHIKAKLD